MKSFKWVKILPYTNSSQTIPSFFLGLFLFGGSGDPFASYLNLETSPSLWATLTLLDMLTPLHMLTLWDTLALWEMLTPWDTLILRWNFLFLRDTDTLGWKSLQLRSGEPFQLNNCGLHFCNWTFLKQNSSSFQFCPWRFF